MSGPLDLPSLGLSAMGTDSPSSISSMPSFETATPSMKLSDHPDLQGIKDAVTKIVGKKGYPDLMANVGAMQAIQKDASEGKDARTQFYESLQGEQNKLSLKRQELLKQMSEGQSMDKSQIAAMMLIGILPTLVGGAIKGKKGVAIGAQAGGLGVQSMAQGLNQESQINRAVAKSGIDSIDSQMKENLDTQNKVKLDQFNAADKAQEGALDRTSRENAASIRAGGEIGAAKITAAELRNQNLQLDINKKDTEQKARQQPIVFNGKVYEPGTVKDENVKSIRDVQAANETVSANIKKMRELTAGQDFGFFQRQIGDKSTELDKLYQSTLDALGQAKESANNNTTKVEYERLEKMLDNPTSFYNNFVSAVSPLSTSVQRNLQITERILNNNFDKYLKSQGMKAPLPIGHEIVHADKKYWLIGVGPNGGLLYTNDPNKRDMALGSK